MDDDELKWGNNIHGVNILGDPKNLDQYIEERHVSGVIATTEDLLQSAAGEQLTAACRTKGLWIRVLRLEFELKE